MRLLLVAATVLSCACANAAQNLPPIQGAPATPSVTTSKRANAGNGSLKAVKSESDLRRMLARVRKQREAREKLERARYKKECLEWSKGLPGQFNCDQVVSESVTVSGAAANTDADTNTQHAGIDEGGLVKKTGDILVVLRRGRLFTIDTSGAQLAAVDMADLAPPQSKPSADEPDWYDELLIADRTVIVIGYSNSRAGSEIVLFDLGERGRLEYRATYNLRSDDYYSGENYASRLVAGKLILYTTRALPDDAENLEWMPAMRQWQPGAAPGFERIAGFDRVFTPAAPLGTYPTVHTMVTCDPAALTFTCEGTVILGDYLSVYYASPAAAYAWTQDYSGDPETRPRTIVYRVPFDGSPITALQVAGEPGDQLAFLESDDAHLNVVVRLRENNDYITSLLRVPLGTFADGSTAAPPESYRELARDLDWMSSRFIGDSVVVGTATAVAGATPPLIVARWRSPEAFTLSLQHGVERIEAIGNDAIVVGPDGDGLGMTTISLAGQPSAANSLRVDRAQQAESRSHGFLYRAASAREGTFGLPLLTRTSSIESASVVFIHNRNLALQTAGSLHTTELEEPEDNCVASCVDWYGNARAIFSGARVFALMGYELVEGRIDANGQIAEANRLNFNPAWPKSKR